MSPAISARMATSLSIRLSAKMRQALIGKQEGDIAAVKTPGGARCLEIIEVRQV